MEEMREFDTFVTTTTDGEEVEMAILEAFAVEDKTYIAAARILEEAIDEEGVYLYELKENGDDIEVIKIKNQFTYDKVSKAYMEMED